MPDDLLVERSRSGDQAAFNTLVERYQKPIYNLCLRMLGERQAAEDAAQEAFISAYRHIAQLRGTNFRAWLFRIATNACYDEMRRRRPSRSYPIRPDQGPSDSDPSHPGLRSSQALPLLTSTAVSPEAYAEQQEAFRHLQRALLILPPEQRLLLVLCDAYGFSYEEAAQIAGLRVGTVKSRLSRGRARLRGILRQWELLPSQERL